jgi:hypothetical protein
MKKFSSTSYIDANGKKALITIKMSEINDLLDRGFIMQPFSGEIKSNSFIVTDKFGKYLFVDEDEAGEELWNSYFDYFVINGSYQSAKTGDKEELMEIYLKKIRRNKKKHREVMEMLTEYKRLVREKKMNPMGIEKFIKGQNWEVIQKIVTETGESWDDSL